MSPTERSRRPTEAASTCPSVRGPLAPLLVPTLPSEVTFGVVGQILPGGSEGELWMELHRLASREALELLDRAGANAEAELERPSGRLERIDRPEVERIAATSRELARGVARREQDLWRTGLLVLGRAASARRADEVRTEIGRRLSGLGFRPRVPVFRARECIARPGLESSAHRPAGYWHTLPTDGAAAFFPFVDESVVEPGGVLIGLLLEDASPVLLDRWSHASHSWGIFGTTGSGKSFAAALLATRSRWRDPGLEVIVLDPLGEFAPWARALGGTVIEVGPGRPGRINPLDPATTGGDRVEKAARAGTLLRSLFPTLRDEESAALDRAIHALYSSGPDVPTFSDLAREVEGAAGSTGRLPTLLQVLTAGSLAYLDGPTTLDLTGAPLVLALPAVPEEHRAFHLTYLLEAVHGRLRRADRHRLVIVDEAHLLARHPATAEYLELLGRVLRHYRAGLLLLSQHPEDFLRTPAGRSLLGNLRATLLLRLTSVSEECRAFFQLTRPESEWLPRARLPREAGYSEGLLRLGASHLPIALVASTPEFAFLSRVLGAPAPTGNRAEADTNPSSSLSEPERRESPDVGGAGARP